MSYSTNTDLVPFAAFYLWEGDGFGKDTPLFISRSEYDYDQDWLDEYELDEVPDDLSEAFGGWKFIPWDERKDEEYPSKKKGRLYPGKVVKGDLVVWYVNSSQYSAGGHVEFTAFSDNKEALQQFIDDLFPEYKDHEYRGKIEEDAIVQQTL